MKMSPMKTYLTRWVENGVARSAVLNVCGIRRIMRKAWEAKTSSQVIAYQLADDVYLPPIPVRLWYDWKYDKLTIYDLSGRYMEKSDAAIGSVKAEVVA